MSLVKEYASVEANNCIMACDAPWRLPHMKSWRSAKLLCEGEIRVCAFEALRREHASLRKL